MFFSRINKFISIKKTLYFLGEDDLLPKSNTVIVKNLPANSTRQSLMEFFSECGDVENIFMSSDSTFQRRAFVQFYSQSQAEMAISILFYLTNIFKTL